MSKFYAAAGLLLSIGVLGASCNDDVDSLSNGIATDPSQVTLCRTISGSLHDRPATVYHVTYSPDILAVDVNGEIVCVDTTSETIQTGLIAVPPVVQPLCLFCDGSPLPAEQFNLAVRLHLRYLPMIYIF